MIRPRSGILVICGVALAVSGCKTIDQLALGRNRADRRQIFQLYGECLNESRSDLTTLAKYCSSVADIRYGREKEEAIARCPLSEYFPCLRR